jgi:hypothetical protein
VNLELKNATVRFDSAGNMLIDAPGYKVVTEMPGQQQGQLGPAGTLKKRYFLVTEAPTPGSVQYDFELLVNGTAVRKFDSSQAGLTVELNPYLQAGQNQIRVNAFKNIQGVRKSSMAQDYFKIMVGSGEVSPANELVIRSVLLTYSRTAADMGSEVFERTMVAE